MAFSVVVVVQFRDKMDAQAKSRLLRIKVLIAMAMATKYTTWIYNIRIVYLTLVPGFLRYCASLSVYHTISQYADI